MFNLFKKSSPVEKLEKQYQKLMEESFHLSKVNRAKSDEKVAEADRILKEIEALGKN